MRRARLCDQSVHTMPASKRKNARRTPQDEAPPQLFGAAAEDTAPNATKRAAVDHNGFFDNGSFAAAGHALAMRSAPDFRAEPEHRRVGAATDISVDEARKILQSVYSQHGLAGAHNHDGHASRQPSSVASFEPGHGHALQLAAGSNAFVAAGPSGSLNSSYTAKGAYSSAEEQYTELRAALLATIQKANRRIPNVPYWEEALVTLREGGERPFPDRFNEVTGAMVGLEGTPLYRQCFELVRLMVRLVENGNEMDKLSKEHEQFLPMSVRENPGALAREDGEVWSADEWIKSIKKPDSIEKYGSMWQQEMLVKKLKQYSDPVFRFVKKVAGYTNVDEQRLLSSDVSQVEKEMMTDVRRKMQVAAEQFRKETDLVKTIVEKLIDTADLEASTAENGMTEPVMDFSYREHIELRNQLEDISKLNSVLTEEGTSTAALRKDVNLALKKMLEDIYVPGRMGTHTPHHGVQMASNLLAARMSEWKVAQRERRNGFNSLNQFSRILRERIAKTNSAFDAVLGYTVQYTFQRVFRYYFTQAIEGAMRTGTEFKFEDILTEVKEQCWGTPFPFVAETELGEYPSTTVPLFERVFSGYQAFLKWRPTVTSVTYPAEKFTEAIKASGEDGYVARDYWGSKRTEALNEYNMLELSLGDKLEIHSTKELIKSEYQLNLFRRLDFEIANAFEKTKQKCVKAWEVMHLRIIPAANIVLEKQAIEFDEEKEFDDTFVNKLKAEVDGDIIGELISNTLAPYNIDFDSTLPGDAANGGGGKITPDNTTQRAEYSAAHNFAVSMNIRNYKKYLEGMRTLQERVNKAAVKYKEAVETFERDTKKIIEEFTGAVDSRNQDLPMGNSAYSLRHLTNWAASQMKELSDKHDKTIDSIRRESYVHRQSWALDPESNGFVEFSPKLYWAVSELPVWAIKCGYPQLDAAFISRTIRMRDHGADTDELDARSPAKLEEHHTLLASACGDIISHRDTTNPRNYMAPTVTLRQTQTRLFMELTSKFAVLFDNRTYERIFDGPQQSLLGNALSRRVESGASSVNSIMVVRRFQ